MIRGITRSGFIRRINRAHALLLLTHQSFPVSHTAARVLRAYPTQNYPPSPKPYRIKHYPQLFATPAIITVPNVLGENQTDAQVQIASRGLTSIVIGSASTSYPLNTIGIQSPVGGTIVIPGALVSLTLSLGPTNAMPDFTGLTLVNATIEINQIGGILQQVVYEDAIYPFPEIARGTVLGQYPLPGTMFTPGVEIVLICASGKIFYPGITESVGNDPVTVVGSTVYP